VEILLVLIALAAGAGLPVQAGVNAAMARFTGRPEGAALVNFAIGLLALAAWLVATGWRWPGGALGRAPWWAWTGGLLGAFYVAAVVLLTPRLGVATTLALAVAGQMLAALLLDHTGALGLPTHPISSTRLAGAALVALGVVLVRR
jgi:transporter family-2 protein